MSPLISRVPGGIPAGGQFAPTAHTEPGFRLGSTISEGQLRDIVNLRQDEGETVIDLTDTQLSLVRAQIDHTGDFSTRAVRRYAVEAYFLENRYTPDEHREFVASRGDISAYFGDPNALRRDIEQMRKDRAESPDTIEGQRP
jgi:hypothetical protein